MYLTATKDDRHNRRSRATAECHNFYGGLRILYGILRPHEPLVVAPCDVSKQDATDNVVYPADTPVQDEAPCITNGEEIYDVRKF